MQDKLDRAFAALADPTRRAIIARLASSEATVNQLAEPFTLSQPAISKHLKVLERAGLISRSRLAQTRPCRLEAAPLREVANWVEAYQQHWEESFERLDSFLRSVQAASPAPAAKPAPRPKPAKRALPTTAHRRKGPKNGF